MSLKEMPKPRLSPKLQEQEAAGCDGINALNDCQRRISGGSIPSLSPDTVGFPRRHCSFWGGRLD